MFKRFLLVHKLATFLSNVASFTSIIADTAKFFITRMNEAFPALVNVKDKDNESKQE